MAHDQRAPSVTDAIQCPLMYLKPSTQHLSSQTKTTLTIHIEECHRSLKIRSCQLSNTRQRFISIDPDPILNSFDERNNLCLVNCSFEAREDRENNHFGYEPPFPLDLSIQFANQTSLPVPRTHLSLYHCARLGLNCTSCIELDPSYGCIWCNNTCTSNESIVTCPNQQRCVQSTIQSVDPVILPVNGGSLVVIQGTHFDLSDVSIHLAEVPCQFIAEDSSNEK